MELIDVDRVLTRFLRPQTPPVAVRLLTDAEEVPSNARMPRRDLGFPIALCQSVAMARRYSWVMAMGGDDMMCPGGAIALGFYSVDADALDGSFEMPFWGDKATRSKIVRNAPRLDYGGFRRVVVAPLARATSAADLVLVYGDAAQVSRLMQANTLVTGEMLTSSGYGAFSCAAEIVLPMLTGRCQVTVPGGGERAVAHTQDHELCFTIPVARLDALLEALAETHKAGSHYPIASHLAYQPEFPKGYAELMEHLRRSSDGDE